MAARDDRSSPRPRPGPGAAATPEPEPTPAVETPAARNRAQGDRRTEQRRPGRQLARPEQSAGSAVVISTAGSLWKRSDWTSDKLDWLQVAPPSKE